MAAEVDSSSYSLVEDACGFKHMTQHRQNDHALVFRCDYYFKYFYVCPSLINHFQTKHVLVSFLYNAVKHALKLLNLVSIGCAGKRSVLFLNELFCGLSAHYWSVSTLDTSLILQLCPVRTETMVSHGVTLFLCSSEGGVEQSDSCELGSSHRCGCAVQFFTPFFFNFSLLLWLPDAKTDRCRRI